MTKLEKVLYTAKAHTTGGRDGGASSCVNQGVTKQKEPRVMEKHTGKQLVITVVDDNPAILQLVAGVLRMQGYRVLEAESGAEALDAAEHHDKPVDLLLTDIDMPGMDGISLWQEVRERWPETKVVF